MAVSTFDYALAPSHIVGGFDMTAMAALAADAPQQAVLVVLSDTGSLGALMASGSFKLLLSTGRLLFATPAVGDAVQLTGDTMVATLSVAAKPSV